MYEMFINQLYKVLVMLDSSGRISAVNSDAFLNNTSGWVEIDSGNGDRYHHAQNNYFEKPIITELGAYRYKLVGGKPVECTPDEIASQEEAMRPVPMPTLEERLDALETTTDDMILLMADLIGGN